MTMGSYDARWVTITDVGMQASDRGGGTRKGLIAVKIFARLSPP